jgi:phosphatidate cytidylyltransferase
MMPEVSSENKFADVPLRVKTWIYIILVFSVSLSHPIAMKIFIAWVGGYAFFEILRMFQIKKNQISASLFLGLSQFCILHFFNFNQYFLYSFLLSIAIINLFLIKEKLTQQISIITLGLILGLYIFPYLYYVSDQKGGIKALIFLVVVTELNDVFQYFMGKIFGKNKVMPKISPNKTWEGLIGGVFITILLSNILGYFLLPSSIISNTALGFILGVFGFFGDVFMSFIKRKTNVKDTGELLPGHGGLLDRMDSLIFNAPIFFWMLPLFLNR